jgi:hypothetical protein
VENVARAAQMRNSCLILVVKCKVTKSFNASSSKYKIGSQRNTSEEEDGNELFWDTARCL